MAGNARGFCYAVYGDAAAGEAARSIASLRASNARASATVVGDGATCGADACIKFDSYGAPGRWAKLNLDTLSPYRDTCYLDADTRIHANLSAGFAALDTGFDVAITHSQHQDEDCLWHVARAEREATFAEIGNWRALQLQAGVFFFRKNEQTAALFAAWRDEWQRWQDQDQAALLRALHRAPVKLWLLGRPFNGGAVVAHRFGSFRQ